jgi:hypothetical protein
MRPYTLLVPVFVIIGIIGIQPGPTLADYDYPPQNPAWASWLPHGYGSTMYVDSHLCAWQKGLHGFRSAPEHIGSWSHPLWGADVNGFYLGPNVPSPDPGWCQLPIGLIYPENSPFPPSPPRPLGARKVHAAHQ